MTDSLEVTDALPEQPTETAAAEETAAVTAEIPEDEAYSLSEADVEALAEGFLQLQQEMPELADIGDVPETVLRTAAREHLPLLDAFLRYRFREQRAVIAEQQRQQRTGEQTAGSLYTGGGQTHPETDAFMRAFQKALN